MKETIEIGAAYIRVSTDDQTELSPDAQLRVILDAAKLDGYTIPPEFIFIEQKGISGRRAENRPEFQRMIAVAKSEQPAPFKRLYLWKFSRFARNQEESTFYKGILRKKCSVDIKSVSEPIAEGMFGRLIETIIEWFDEYYSYNLSGEVVRGMTEKALREGYQASPSLGYQAAGEGKPFQIRPDKMKMVEYIFTAYHSGKDMTGIARECNEFGWRTNRGHPFERRTILRILQNRFYIGDVKWKDITFRGAHELSPVVCSVFDAVQERIEREYRPIRRREVSSCKHWLSGVFKCGICGASMSFNKASNPKKRSDIFQCWKYLKGFHDGSVSISVRKAENFVLCSMKEVLDSREIQYEYIPDKDEKQVTEFDLVVEALIKLEYKAQRVKEAYEAGIDTIEEYKANKLRLQDERKKLEDYQRQLLDQQPKDTGPDKNEVLSRVQRVYDLLSDPDVDYEVKGNALRSIVKQVSYNRQTGEFKVYYYV